jgi:Zn2+/Cd2+-exporting ATPase
MCNKHHHEHGHCHDNEGGCGCGCHHHHEENEAPMWRALLPMAVAALLLIVGIVANPLPAWPWAVFVLAYLPVGLPILKEAGEEIAKGDIFNEFTLMVLATIGAFAIGEYPEAVAVLLFYSVGEYFQDRAVGRARRDIQSLVNLRPDTAIVIDHDGRRTNVKPEAVEVGSVIEVVAGERVPLDGTLLTEHAVPRNGLRPGLSRVLQSAPCHAQTHPECARTAYLYKVQAHLRPL